MKLIIAITMVLIATSADAEVYQGKKFKMTYDKKTRTLEGEVWDTTKSEHLLIIKTQPEVKTNPTITTDEAGKLQFK